MNLPRFQIIAIIATMAVLIAACSTSRPIVNFHDQYVPSKLTMKQVSQSIQTSVNKTPWQAHAVRAGLIEAKLHYKGFVAAVDINYNTKAYSLTYKSSQGLGHEGNEIHRNYNRWAANLNNAVQLGFQKLQHH